MSHTIERGLRRFDWSHQSSVHRTTVRVGNRLLARVPFRLKYVYGAWRRRNRPPYDLVRGRVSVQVGAPADTLHAGRSRGFYFSWLAGNDGHVIVIEPDPFSAAEFARKLEHAGITNTVVCQQAAWNDNATVDLQVNRQHRATNFIAGLVPYTDARLADYSTVPVHARPLDDILETVGNPSPYLVSITTNWAERTIIAGMTRTLSQVEFISVAYGPDGELYHDWMRENGFDFFSYDDRGATFKRRRRDAAQSSCRANEAGIHHRSGAVRDEVPS